ncbi:uncharacterized protein LOC128823088 isoform X1 [Malaclemys terrapin pileata]|uniref:uncharacterized protein LOC128823088 isoform X1 n=1 Tax=Malaclemys terrapin pileata TaxID=2991368 RepID=UPI0023A89A7C|nr:uncharacterized protein LOC128823088 isoform X1 [Malaclemys terrapin pileata]
MPRAGRHKTLLWPRERLQRPRTRQAEPQRPARIRSRAGPRPPIRRHFRYTESLELHLPACPRGASALFSSEMKNALSVDALLSGRSYYRGDALYYNERQNSAANFSSLPPPSRRLSQIRRRKKRTQEEMFAEIMESTRNERAHLNDWKDTVSKYRKDASECEDRRDQREDMRDARDERWWQEDQRRQDATLGLLREQTDMLRRLVELQEWQQDHRLPLQTLYNHPPPSPCSIASSPRRVRTCVCGGKAPCTLPFHPSGQPKQKAVIILTFF